MNLALEDSPNSGSTTDRRVNSRFPLREEVTYKVIGGKALAITGTGKTLNIGSGGILFTTQEKLPMGRTVELSVSWPARLGGTCALKFVAMGRIVRSYPDKAVVKIERYEFRTRGTAAPNLSTQ
jgi:hypothetical protein